MVPALRLGLPLVLVALTMVSVASAEENCPVGSSEKKENGLTWCEPSVCQTEAQCPTGMLCRPVPLCIEIGTVSAGAGDAGNRLMVRQRCGENKSCPQNTTCLDSGRCVTPTQASALPSPSGSSSAPPADAPKKSGCGCDVVGTSSSSMGAACAGLGLLVMAARRRRR